MSHACDEQCTLVEWFIKYSCRWVGWREAELDPSNRKSTKSLKDYSLLEGKNVDNDWHFRLSSSATERLKLMSMTPLTQPPHQTI